RARRPRNAPPSARSARKTARPRKPKPPPSRQLKSLSPRKRLPKLRLKRPSPPKNRRPSSPPHSSSPRLSRRPIPRTSGVHLAADEPWLSSRSGSPARRTAMTAVGDGASLILVGQVGGAFGVRGEVRITAFTAEPLALLDYRDLKREDGSPALTLLSGR